MSNKRTLTDTQLKIYIYFRLFMYSVILWIISIFVNDMFLILSISTLIKIGFSFYYLRKGFKEVDES